MAGERYDIWRGASEEEEDAFESAVAEGRKRWRSEVSSDAGVGSAIAQELVKSYGFKRSKGGQWEWSLSNIAQSFKDDPFWTTLDYLSLAVPVLKWGSAARGIAKGAGAVGKAYQAGAFAGKSAKSLGGRAIGALAGRELGAAAEVYLKSGAAKPLTVAAGEYLTRKAGDESTTLGRALGSTGRALETAGRKLYSPGANPLSKEFVELGNEYGLDKWGETVFARSIETERMLAETAASRRAQDLLGRAQKLPAADQRALSAAYRAGGASLEVLSERAQGVLKDTLAYRTELIDQARHLGVAGEKEALEAIEKGAPRVYKEIEEVRAQTKGFRAKREPRREARTAQILNPVERAAAAGKEGTNLTEVFDPAADLAHLANIGQAVAKQKFVAKFAESNLARYSGEVATAAMDAVRSGDVETILKLGIPPARLKSVRNLLDKAPEMIDGEEVAQLLGWKKIKDLVPEGLSPKDMGFLSKLPAELADKMVDPNVADDLAGALGFYADKGRWAQLNQKVLNYFRQTKTVLNPGTQVRNYLGMVVSSHLARGGMVKLAPRKGYQEWMKGGDRYLRAIEAGILNSSTDEFRDYVTRGVRKFEDPKDYDFELFGKQGTNWLKKGADKADKLYAANDEVWKLDTWMEISDDLVKRGYGLDEAERLATAEVARYMPTYTNRSEFSRALSQAIPFSGFTTEVVRTWKNAYTFKPHMAFFWNHMASSMSEVFGAMAGFSPQQLESAKEGLPKEMRGDSSLVLPFDIGGKPQFLDLSYVIPGASWAGVAEAPENFFRDVANPLGHPVASIASVATTGRDTFMGKEVQPTMAEAAGFNPEGPATRRAVSLIEHTAKTLLPTWGGGYATQDMIELARGVKDPNTGEDVEPSAGRAALRWLGMKTMAPSVENAAKRSMRDNSELGKRLEVAWDAWDRAEANGDEATMQTMERKIATIQAMAGHPDPMAYLQKSMKRRLKAFGQLSKSDRKALLERVGDLNLKLSPEDKRLMARLKRGE